MKRIRNTLIILLIISILLITSGCSKPSDSFTLLIICESKGIYQIFFTSYVNDEKWAIGGISSVDHLELSADAPLKKEFSKAYFEGQEDISGFSIDFSPYRKDDLHEAGTTNVLHINAEYGKVYTVVISGDALTGFSAKLQ